MQQETEIPEISEEEKFRIAYNKAKALKEEGNKYYREKDYTSAIKKYYEASENLHNEKYQKSRNAEYLDLKLTLVTNISQALYASKSYSDVIDQCKYSEKEFPNSVKLKYYHALALSEQSEFEEAITLLRSALNLEPTNKSVSKMIKEISQKKKQHNEELKKSYGGMFLNKDKPKPAHPSPSQSQSKEPKNQRKWGWGLLAGLGLLAVGGMFLINYTRQTKSH